jgi:hypothetical protein
MKLNLVALPGEGPGPKTPVKGMPTEALRRGIARQSPRPNSNAMVYSPRSRRTPRGVSAPVPCASPRKTSSAQQDAKAGETPRRESLRTEETSDAAAPLVRGLPNSSKSSKPKKGTETVDDSWAREVFSKYDRDGHGSIDLSDLEPAFNDLRLPVSADVLQRYVKTMADAEGVDLGSYAMHGVPSGDFFKIYRQMLAQQAPEVRKRATVKELCPDKHRPTLSDMRSQENDVREAFERHLSTTMGEAKTCSKFGIEEALKEVGLPDVKGDHYESFIDFWLQKRDQENIDQPLDAKGEPAFDFQEFTLVVNDYHTYVDIRADLPNEDPETIFEHDHATQFHTLRMATTPRKIEGRGGASKKKGLPGQVVIGAYGNQVSLSHAAVARDPQSAKTLGGLRAEMGICA